MQRYFVSTEQMKEKEIEIIGDDAHHLKRVLRAKSGLKIIVSDGESNEVLAQVEQIEDDRVIAVPLERLHASGEPAVEVWIAQSLPKGEKFETVVQKCTELGASRIIPFRSARTVVRYDEKKLSKKRVRWQKIAKEAAEQSHRSKIPTIEWPIEWEELLQQVPNTNALLCYEQEHSKGLKTALQNDIRHKGKGADNVPFLIIIGPEGGLTESEVEEASAAGCISVHLGRRILRTETAAMVALTCVMYEHEEMN